MKTDIKMPKLSPDMKKGIVACWLKEEGEVVKKGEPLFEVETDKVVEQIEAEEDGRLVKQCAEEGDEIGIDEVVAVLEKD